MHTLAAKSIMNDGRRVVREKATEIYILTIHFHEAFSGLHYFKYLLTFHSECLESFTATIATMDGPVEMLGQGKASGVRCARQWSSQSLYGR